MAFSLYVLKLLKKLIILVLLVLLLFKKKHHPAHVEFQTHTSVYGWNLGAQNVFAIKLLNSCHT